MVTGCLASLAVANFDQTKPQQEWMWKRKRTRNNTFASKLEICSVQSSAAVVRLQLQKRTENNISLNILFCFFFHFNFSFYFVGQMFFRANGYNNALLWNFILSVWFVFFSFMCNAYFFTIFSFSITFFHLFHFICSFHFLFCFISFFVICLGNESHASFQSSLSKKKQKLKTEERKTAVFSLSWCLFYALTHAAKQ